MLSNSTLKLNLVSLEDVSSHLLMKTLLMHPVRLVLAWSGIPPRKVAPPDVGAVRPLVSIRITSLALSGTSSMYRRILGAEQQLTNSLNTRSDLRTVSYPLMLL